MDYSGYQNRRRSHCLDWSVRWNRDGLSFLVVSVNFEHSVQDNRNICVPLNREKHTESANSENIRNDVTKQFFREISKINVQRDQ